MGYVIRYAEDINADLQTYKKRNIYIISLPIVIFLLFMIFAPIRRWLYDSFIPSNFEIASAEFSNMILELEQGKSFTDAITVFCREIIHEN